MFDNPGSKIKSVATVVTAIYFIVFFVMFIMGLLDGEVLSAFGILIVGGLSAYLLGLFLYATGELVENTTTIKNVLTKEAEPVLSAPAQLSVASETRDNPLTDEEIHSYASLAASPVIETRQSVASDSQAPGEILRKLAEDPVNEVRIKVAVNPSTPADVLHALASDPSAAIRACVAKNPGTAAETLHILSRDSFEMAAERAKQNPNFRG